MQHSTLTLLHNPRCSKSREVLAMLESRNLRTEVRLYRQSPLSNEELATLITRLEQPAAELVRVGDAKKLGLTDSPGDLSDQQICIWLAEHPESMQRPILIIDGRAVIGRPPEKILPFIDNVRT